MNPNKFARNIFEEEEGFSLLEMLITLAIFGILMVTTTSLLVINLTVSRKVKARTYAREETAFMLNVLKKDIRNAEPGLTVSEGGNELRVTVVDPAYEDTSHNYVWSIDGNRIERKEDPKVSYNTPSDIEFSDLVFDSLYCDENNCVIKITVQAWTIGMPGDKGEGCDSENKQCIKKEVAVSTRNFEFE